MTDHRRKYGEKDSHPIPVWNGIFDHQERIGIALWTFLWLIDRIPKDAEQNSVGKVLGGKPVKIREIQESIKGATYQMVRDQLDLLAEHGYITKKRTAYGFVIAVQKSQKWGVWAKKEIVPRDQSQIGLGEQSGTKRLVPQTTQIGPPDQNKENTAIHSSRAATFWKDLNLNPKILPGAFRVFCEEMWDKRGDQTSTKAAGACMDGWTAMGNRIPAPFAKATADLRKNSAPASASQIPVLEVEPWA